MHKFSSYFENLEQREKRIRAAMAASVFVLLLLLVIAVTLPFRNSILSKFFNKKSSQAASSISSSGDWYWLMLDWANCCPLHDAQSAQSLGMENANSFWQPLDAEDYRGFTASNNLKMALFYPLANRNMPHYGGYVYDQANIDRHVQMMKDFTSQMPPNSVFWDGMAEFDQGGGDWETGRPDPAPGQSKQSYHDTWTNYFLNTLGLNTYLSQTQEQRGYAILSMCDYSSCPHYALEMGANAVMVERNTDELADEAVSIPFVRGAAKQYDKPWGIDYSSYRGQSDVLNVAPYGTTVYDQYDKLISGWDTSFYKRNMYLGYFAGLNITAMEPTEYHHNNDLNQPMNPQGKLVQAFGDFALKRHSNRGKAFVPFALLEDKYAGFDPKFGQYSQADATWYDKIPYDNGDYLMNNILKVAYPDHWTHATKVPGGPQSPTEYKQRLANGEDPRPWEPMGKTKWGNVFDVLTTNTPQGGLSNYKVVFLTIGYQIDQTLRDKISQFVQNGGTVVVNSSQVTSSDATLTGVTLGATAQSANSKWSDGTSYNEPTYNYTKVTPTSASVIATNSAGDPVITKNSVGSGFVYLITPQMMEDVNKTQILNVVQKLMDDFNTQLAPMQVQSNQSTAAYDITTDNDKTVVAIANNDLAGSTWTGTLSFPVPTGTYTAHEWISDQSLSTTVQNGRVIVTVTVPAYDVKVFALEYPSQGSTQSTGPTASPWEQTWSIPTKIEAENFRSGGEGVGYHDTTPGNNGDTYDPGQSYRSGDVDIEPTLDAGGGYDVGWTAAGEWLAYNITTPTSQTLQISLRAGTALDGKTVHFTLDETPIGSTIAIPNTGSYQTYTTVQGPWVTFSPGNHTLKLYIDTDDITLNYLTIGDSPATVLPTILPTTTPIPTATPRPTLTPTPRPTATTTPKPTTAPISVNLIQNPGFENGNSYWQTASSSWVLGNAHSGNNSVRITSTGGTQYQIIPNVSGTYTLTAWAKVSASGTTGIIGIHLLDANGKVLADIGASPYVTSTGYTKFTKVVTASGNVRSIKVYVYKLSGSGYVYADDFSLIKN